MTNTQNPLYKHFRQPALYISLPSGGKFYPADSLDMPPNNELPIFPMTAYDEAKARTPDALFNGSAIVDIVASCVPNIHDPWQMPIIDLNALLAAIRIASYGNDMEIATICPACENRMDVTIDLRQVLDSFGSPDYNAPLQIGDLEFYFSPMNYTQLNEISRMQFEDQKVLSMIGDSSVSDEEKIRLMGDAYRRVTQLTIKSIASSVSAVRTTDTLVTDKDNINEFLMNAPKALYEKVRQQVIALREQSDTKPLAMQCDSCNHEYKQEFTLDMSNFFETAS